MEYKVPFSDCTNKVLISPNSETATFECNKDQGHISIYSLDDHVTWIQKDSTIQGANSQDKFFVTSLLADGIILVGGEIWRNKNGHNADHIRVFKHLSNKN